MTSFGKLLFALAFVFYCAPPSLHAQTSSNDTEGWVNLFDGKSIDGWIQRDGKATYEIHEGAIVGTTVPNTPNSFLCTPGNYSDFQLQLEFKVHPDLNSGIQIRSNSIEDYQNGRVHGYQIEIDPSRRAYSAGIYDEARRGWLNSLDNNAAARFAFRQNEWNELRIEAIGSHFRTWLNGVPAANLTDEMTKEGFIALQVHGVGGRKDPLTIMWRNIRVRETSTPWPPEEIRPLPAQPANVFQPDTLKKIADGFRFVEGPAVGPNGKIYFNDIPNNRTHVYDPETETVEVFREPTGNANGLFWTPNDYLLSCQGGTRQLTLTRNGEQEILAEKFENKKLNSPNDLVLDAVGGIYFTDPRYGKRDDLEMEIEGVYYIASKGKLTRVLDDLTRPNGLIISPDYKTLYVADLGEKTIWAYDIVGDGKINNKRKFADVGSDGMSVDELGNVYCTYNGQVIAFDSSGKEVARLTPPEAPANCLVVDHKMYITARTGFYVVDMNVNGLPH